MSDSILALAHYRQLFPTVSALGTASTYEVWQAEYDRVVASGLSATLITSTNFEGAAASGARNFEQKILLHALLTRRAELDPDFDELVFAPPAVKARRNLGITVLLG